ncbi:hypothetical protein YC2023_041663 [Brassica napus]|uniref:Uncharacterized protein n=1 Tax=Brassica oleracea TaxID=3712 RepID=A0A3P6B1I4_BRAOL|nr:unnamed protein product [Brassica oleracea]
MEGKGKVGSSSSSSFTNQLFGPKEPSSSSNFSSIFPPPSKGTTGNMILSSKHGSLGQCQESATCNLSSSLYYGGQDVYSGSTSNHTYHTGKDRYLTLTRMFNHFRLTRLIPEETVRLVKTTRWTHLEETGGKAYIL